MRPNFSVEQMHEDNVVVVGIIVGVVVVVVAVPQNNLTLTNAYLLFLVQVLPSFGPVRLLHRLTRDEQPYEVVGCCHHFRSLPSLLFFHFAISSKIQNFLLFVLLNLLYST